jgi:hypothetical protein
MMCKFQLVWLMRMRITVVLVKFFRRVEGFKVEQRASIKFCVNLKKTATETFEMFKNTYDEESLSRTSASEWNKRYTEAQKVRMQKSPVKAMLTAFFYDKGIVHHEFVLENQAVNGKFYKEVIKSLIARVRRVKLEFQESGSWYLLHDKCTDAFFGLCLRVFW